MNPEKNGINMSKNICLTLRARYTQLYSENILHSEIYGIIEYSRNIFKCNIVKTYFKNI